jgi:phage N-6-adenine-methyltransferase
MTETIPPNAISGGPQSWRTPPSLLRQISWFLGWPEFRLDAAADKHNAVCKEYYTIEDNGLKQPWVDPTFCNPPHRRCLPWIEKAASEAEVRKVRSCLLVPARTETAYFEAALQWGDVVLMTPRVAYLHPETGVAHAGHSVGSVLCVFGASLDPRNHGTQQRVFYWDRRSRDEMSASEKS